MALNEIEARLLGSLIEKSLTTPDLYPLTYHALTSACNQKTSREPVMSLGEEQVGQGLHGLLEKSLVERVHETGSRVPKFRHRADRLVDGEDPKLIGAICVLLLRGPQTPGEIKTRSERLCRFESSAEVESLLQELSVRPSGPLVAKLPRQPGQKESRYRHLFGGEAPPPASSVAPAPAAAEPDRVDALARRVEALEARLDALQKAEPN